MFFFSFPVLGTKPKASHLGKGSALTTYPAPTNMLQSLKNLIGLNANVFLYQQTITTKLVLKLLKNIQKASSYHSQHRHTKEQLKACAINKIFYLFKSEICVCASSNLFSVVFNVSYENKGNIHITERYSDILLLKTHNIILTKG